MVPRRKEVGVALLAGALATTALSAVATVAFAGRLGWPYMLHPWL